MSHCENLINPSRSRFVIYKNDDSLNPTHLALPKNLRETMKMPDKPLDITSLYNKKFLFFLTEEDQMLLPTVSAFQAKMNKKNANTGRNFST